METSHDRTAWWRMYRRVPGWLRVLAVLVVAAALASEISDGYNSVSTALLRWASSGPLFVSVAVLVLMPSVTLVAIFLLTLLVMDSVAKYAEDALSPGIMRFLLWKARRQPTFRDDQALLAYSFDRRLHQDRLLLAGEIGRTRSRRA